MPAAWFVVPLTFFAIWYVSLLPSQLGYGTAATAAASGALPFIASFVGATSAWEAARLRRSGIWGGPWSRRGLQIAAGLVAGPFIAGLLTLAAAVITAHALAAAPTPNTAIVAVMILNLVAYSSIGFALGIRLPTPLAVPLAAILPMLWLAFVPAMYPVWLRHLTGMYRDCCLLEQTIAPQAVIASAALDLAFIAAAIVACADRRPRLHRALMAIGFLGGGFLVGVLFAAGLTFAPVIPRDPSLLSCTSTGATEVCLWPEHADAENQILATVSEVRERWLASGIKAPTTFTEAAGAHPPETAEVHFRDLSEDGMILALADGMLPPLNACGQATMGGVAIPFLEAWYAASGGLSHKSLEALNVPGDSLNPPLLTVVDQLTMADESTRRAWEVRAATIAQTCGAVVPDLRVNE